MEPPIINVEEQEEGHEVKNHVGDELHEEGNSRQSLFSVNISIPRTLFDIFCKVCE